MAGPVDPLRIGPMSDKTFHRFRDYIQTHLGIKMPDVKKTMLQARLQKRMRVLGIDNFDAYFEHVFSSRGKKGELLHMIDAVTTNKTEFFREGRHFDYLTAETIPEMERVFGSRALERFRIWSAGCSTGEEPYTIAMVLMEYMQTHPRLNFRVTATDISLRALKTAAGGIYTHEKVTPVSMPLRKKYLLRSRNRERDLVRISPVLRDRITFRRLNLMEDGHWFPEPFHVVFFRNVLIYFDRATQEAVLTRILRHVSPGGYLFVGHAETLSGLPLPLTPVTTAVYRFRERRLSA